MFAFVFTDVRKLWSAAAEFAIENENIVERIRELEIVLYPVIA